MTAPTEEGTVELQPCPFCGSPVDLHYAGSSDWVADCRTAPNVCGASVTFWVRADNESEEAKRRWNRRAARAEARELPHLYEGDCPDEHQPDARDPHCPACRALSESQPGSALSRSPVVGAVGGEPIPEPTAVSPLPVRIHPGTPRRAPNYSDAWGGGTEAEMQAARARCYELERAVLTMANALRNREWAEHVSGDHAIVALEAEVTKLVGEFNAAATIRAPDAANAGELPKAVIAALAAIPATRVANGEWHLGIGGALDAYRILATPTGAAPDHFADASKMIPAADDIAHIRAWFNAVQDLNPAFLDDRDRAVMARLCNEPQQAPAQDPEFVALMAMSEPEIDAELRALGIDPETAARKAGEAIAEGVARSKCRGYICRLCGKDTPHQHTPEEIIIFRNGVKFARLATPVAADESTRAPDARFEKALRRTWQMVDPLNPPGQPGSYARGEYNGIVAALKTLRENYDRCVVAPPSGERPSAPAPEGENHG